jgi:hypothetical protein
MRGFCFRARVALRALLERPDKTQDSTSDRGHDEFPVLSTQDRSNLAARLQRRPRVPQGLVRDHCVHAGNKSKTVKPTTEVLDVNHDIAERTYDTLMDSSAIIINYL